MADRPFEEELDSLKSDIAHLRSDVADLTNVIRGTASERAIDMKAQLQERMDATREQVRRRLKEARERSGKALDDVEEKIGEHPIGSIATAVGVGFLIAKLMDLGNRR
ncbi:MAG: hypothetical protein WDA11_06525 [Thiohalomonadaceae bacterium]